LQIAENTVRGYVSDLLAAFQVTNRTRLALEVARRGLLSPAGGVRDTIVMRDSR
jgi:DNA-binding NarL/FixJ family response regulator